MTARLRYLSDASHLLGTRAPVTSRHLMSRHNALLFDNDIEKSDAQRRKACGACGTLLVVGWEATLEIKGHTKRKAQYSSTRPGVMVYECGTCYMNTRLPIDPAPKITSRPGITSKTISKNPLPFQSSSGIPNPPKPSPHKKRSKSAKQGGLKALLQKKRENDSTSSGFHLMDFMKSS